MSETERQQVIVLGGGPAGLGLALRLAKRRCFDVTVLERNAAVGGNAGSFELGGVRVDFGSHRLHPACSEEILRDIQSMLGDELLIRPRHGRIRLRGRWLHFPLKITDLALGLPPTFMGGVIRDSVLKPFQRNGQSSFASVLEKGLGRTICRDFYFPYARKIWGLDPTELDAEQAKRRVSASSVTKLIGKVLSNVPGMKPKGAGKFYYPRKGFGQISDAYYEAALKAGAKVELCTSVTGIEIENQRAVAVTAQRKIDSATTDRTTDNEELHYQPCHVFSTIPLPVLIRTFQPQTPDSVLASADKLRYRAMILVYLVLETDQFTEYDAHYFPSSDLKITRLSEPKNYSLAGEAGTTVLCAELPCAVNDDVWSQSDEQLGQLVRSDLATAGIPVTAAVSHVTTRRLPQAYPIYTTDYREHFDRLDQWANTVSGLTSLGRQGLFAHDNTHHTLAMSYAADECLQDSGAFDLNHWSEKRREFESHVVVD